jgi:hypothetical protein
MMYLLEVLTGFYWILIPQYILESLFRARWRDAYDSGGPLGVAVEGIGSAFGLNSAIFYIDMGGRWNQRRIKKMLEKHGVPLWGWGYAYHQLYFHVPKEDWEFARNMMLREGVELIEY